MTKHEMQNKPKLFSRIFLLLVFVSLCCFVCGQGLNSGTSVYLDRIGQTATLSGALAAVFSLAAAVVRIVGGPIIDNSGRFRVFVAGTIVMAVGTIACAWATTIPTLVICRALQGAGFSAATTATATAAADVLPKERLGEGIGYFGLGQAIAMSIGPAFALFLAGTDPATNVFVGLGAVAMCSVVGAFCCNYESRPEMLPETSAYRRNYEETAGQSHEKKSILAAFRIENIFEKRALIGAIPNLIIGPTFGFGIFFVGLYGSTLGVGTPGLFFTISACVMIVIRLVSSRFMDTVAPFKLAIIPAAAGVICYVLLFNAAMGDLVFYVAGAFYGICLGLAAPLNQSVAVKNTPQDRWGAANAIVLLAVDLGVGLSAFLWGVTNDLFGFQFTTVCVMVCLVAFLISTWFLYPKTPQIQAE